MFERCATASLRGGAGSVCCTRQRRRSAGCFLCNERDVVVLRSGAGTPRLQRGGRKTLQTATFAPSLRVWADSAEMGPCFPHDPHFPYGAVQISSSVAQACHQRAAGDVKSVLENP